MRVNRFEIDPITSIHYSTLEQKKNLFVAVSFKVITFVKTSY